MSEQIIPTPNSPITTIPTEASTISPETPPSTTTSSTFPSHLEPHPSSTFKPTIRFEQFKCESQLKALTDMIDQELSEPYSVFTYRGFTQRHPELCIFLYDDDKCIGGILSKIDFNKNNRRRGYIGMLVVSDKYRGQKLGSQLVRLTMKIMFLQGIDICLLETECNNFVALTLYENLGFVRTKLLPRYYMNNSDAFRLKFWLTPNVMVTHTVQEMERQGQLQLLQQQKKQQQQQTKQIQAKDGKSNKSIL